LSPDPQVRAISRAKGEGISLTVRPKRAASVSCGRASDADDITDIQTLENFLAALGNLIPAEIGLDPPGPVLNMSEGGFAEVVETKQPSGNGKSRFQTLEVFLGGPCIDCMDIADGMTDPEGVREKADALFL
jgi:hypothetical protein